MTTELQNKAWSVLPKEFKEEVKKEYNLRDKFGYEEKVWLYENLFGTHNLTSDTEGEEMLIVPRSKVIEIYNPECDGETLYELFGSKCLPDELNEDNKLEPKFKVGDPVIYKGIAYIIHDGDGIYVLKDVFGKLKDGAVLEQDLEPYEPKYHVGQTVRYLGQNREIGEIAAYYKDEPGRYSVRFGKEYHNISESMLEPYIELTNVKTDKELQDRVWQSLPEDFKNFIYDKIESWRGETDLLNVAKLMVVSEILGQGVFTRVNKIINKELAESGERIANGLNECIKGNKI